MNSELPAAAMPAWLAYVAMSESKQRHFDYLQNLETKYQKYGQPSATEKVQLKILLDEHTRQVQLFRGTVLELKQADPTAHAALLARLAGPGKRS